MLTSFRARRALQRQLAYQRTKSPPSEASLLAYARHVQQRISMTGRVLEVGSGPHGLIFFLGIDGAVGVDPLADEYARLYPEWQSRARTVLASGEALPFADASFDTVLCDNVVDHAKDPTRILGEIARVLAPGGQLYFTVNVHHWIYGVLSHLYPLLPFRAFADHTVHLTHSQARALLNGFTVKGETLEQRPRRSAFTRLFFKNARYEALCSINKMVS